ncbi:hypothetical protein GIB67_007354 [Kingdonia uniflora]|uniref:EF-hand domain-containing protein n=1 Tax=Kingdonia uniflora TaxID=39325 RepID=A0A7J7NXM4_9MAGN|nr:hypothetical protein GIB67_007354 [Kingdonia uniflora]
MENTCLPLFSLAGFIWFLVLHRVLNWFIRVHKSYSTFQSFFQSQLNFLFEKNPIYKVPSEESCENEKSDCELLREDVEMVMDKLGIICTLDDDKLQLKFGLDGFSILFEENEPSLDEVKEAFDVFDENKDGFIDARELEMILFSLGFRKKYGVLECERMIAAFDENGDGRIDFNEFLKFMENSFC